MQEGARPPRIFNTDAAVPTPEVVELTPIELDTFQAEYVIRPPNLIIHLYRKSDGTFWTYEDAQPIWEAMVEVFNLQGRENQLTVEFIPELYSWCVTVEKVAVIMPPSHKKVLESLQAIETRKVGTNASLDRG